ncbi:hypothetical protein EG347_01965 [Chryseobacterium sp. G0186]|uniref:hypothetical protein n=1 Tax=Chryseobacterium sp. G0186 TaxID=2487064 RepID=UPI000F4E927A|nr:hypothetical protein [Chryseobacterium sp. G0186]AZA76377.1 hypothetical protein EG347_01965 [Chryseobacterium sp. G0186]
MNMELIDCANHGSQPFGVVCGHLQSNGKKLGFHEQEAEEGRKPDAWCNDCHERWQLMKQSEKEREQWEEVCNFKVVCGACYEEIKEENKTANTFDLEVLTIEKLLNQLSKQEYPVILAQSFPSWLPEAYVQMMSNIATQVISIESKLLSMEDAIQVNLDRDKTDEWVFATSIAKDYWTFDIEQNIMYYEQIEEHFVPKKMNIHFNQWLQLCFLLQKLDHVQEKYLITIALQEALQESLYIINPSLVDHFKNII